MSMKDPGAKSKTQRSYDATRRQERARQQREEALGVARRLFLERGYVATTVESIATTAGVSAATIYKTYGGKAGLVRELCERALAGSGATPAEERSDALRAGADPREVVAGWGELVAEVSPLVSPLLLLLRAAAESDADAAALAAELDQSRLRRMAENARFLVEGGHARAGTTVEQARDVLWFCSSPETYELLVVRRGWTVEQLGAFAATTMAANLL
jgi:AcrR family transcriptional regulator